MKKNILAYFKSPEEAENAAAKLKSLSVADMQIDRFSRYPDGEMNSYFNPAAGDIRSLASMTLNADISNRSAGILASADVNASGLSDGGQGGPTGRDVLLTVVVGEAEEAAARQIIADGGGMM